MTAPNPPQHSGGVVSPFHLLKCGCVEQVQFHITQVLDGFTQVFWQDMPLRSGFGCRLCGGW